MRSVRTRARSPRDHGAPKDDQRPSYALSTSAQARCQQRRASTRNSQQSARTSLAFMSSSALTLSSSSSFFFFCRDLAAAVLFLSLILLSVSESTSARLRVLRGMVSFHTNGQCRPLAYGHAQGRVLGAHFRLGNIQASSLRVSRMRTCSFSLHGAAKVT